MSTAWRSRASSSRRSVGLAVRLELGVDQATVMRDVGSDIVHHLDEIDEPERTRRLWEDTIRPLLEADGRSPAEIEALRVKYEVPA